MPDYFLAILDNSAPISRKFERPLLHIGDTPEGLAKTIHAAVSHWAAKKYPHVQLLLRDKADSPQSSRTDWAITAKCDDSALAVVARDALEFVRTSAEAARSVDAGEPAKPKRLKRGAKGRSPERLKQDRQVVSLWKSGAYSAFQEIADHMGIPREAVKWAVDIDRKVHRR